MLDYLPTASASQLLIEELANIPQAWTLTPVRYDKRPYRTAWNTEAPLDPKSLIAEINTGAKGYGLRTGCVSGGILAIDADGYAAEELLQKLSQGNLPDTVTFTSGKPGRRQLLYFIPAEYWGKIKTLRLKTGVADTEGKEELLEFRWNDCQSVLPPSQHPETGRYSWIRSPQEIAVARCPMWLIDFFLNYQPQKLNPQRQQFPPKEKKSSFFDFLPSVTIHGAIADPGNWESKNSKGQVAGHGCVQLWYFFRGIDFQGAGNVVIDLRIVAASLDKSLYTIRRWLKFGLAMGFFRGCRRVGTKTYRIFYTSLENICNRLNLADIGACTDIELSELKNSKFIATEATAKQLQEQSKFQASSGKRKNLKKCIPTAEVLTTSDLCTGAILHKAGRFTYLKFYAHPHGGSQKKIAYELGRHPSTVQRRLSDGYRQRHALKPIPKTQLLASPKRTVIDHVPCPGDKTRTMTIRGIDKGFKQKIWKTSLGYFRLCPNVYDLEVELTSKRRLRSKIKRSAKGYEFTRQMAEEDEFKRWMSGEGRELREQ